MKNTNLLFGLSSALLIAACSSDPQNKKLDNLATAMHGKIVETAAIAADTASKKNKNMKGYKINIEKATLENSDFRRVLYTGKYMQLVLMTLKPGEEIGAEIHQSVDQFFRFESGKGQCLINGLAYDVANGDVIIVPAGALHNVINTSSKNELKLYTIYSPPNHKDKVVRVTKKEAETNGEKFDGSTTE